MGKFIRFQAHGVSMKPLVRDGDMLFVEPLCQEPIRLGEVVLCRTNNNRVIVHRVVQRHGRKDKKTYLVQGDQVRQPDGWLEKGQILGRLTTVERDGRVIDLEKPTMKTLGVYAALRSRFGWGTMRLPRFGAKIAKHLPFIGFLLR